MLFMYWDGNEVPGAASAWREQLGDNFRIYNDNDVLECLDDAFQRQLYKSIRLPACKSDIARLVMLRQHGGFYIDAHIMPTNPSKLLPLFAALFDKELLLFEREDLRTSEGEIRLINSIIGARKCSATVNVILQTALTNLSDQRERERQAGCYVPYNIFTITGPWHVSSIVLDRSQPQYKIRARYAENIGMFTLVPGVDSGFRLYGSYGYRTLGSHWSERQKTERLFSDCFKA